MTKYHKRKEDIRNEINQHEESIKKLHTALLYTLPERGEERDIIDKLRWELSFVEQQKTELELIESERLKESIPNIKEHLHYVNDFIRELAKATDYEEDEKIKQFKSVQRDQLLYLENELENELAYTQALLDKGAEAK